MFCIKLLEGDDSPKESFKYAQEYFKIFVLTEPHQSYVVT